MPVAYLIVEMKINDPELCKRCMAAAPATVKAAGGEETLRPGRRRARAGLIPNPSNNEQGIP